MRNLKIRDAVINLISNSSRGLTCEEIAIKLTGESKQNVFSPIMTDLKECGIVKIVDRRDTTNGRPAAVYMINDNDGDTVNLFDETFVESDEENTMTLENAVAMQVALIVENKFKSDTHFSCVMPITHDQALFIRDNLFNEHNRDVMERGRNVVEIENAMKEGSFKPTSTLIFDQSGKLIDGHHRITAHCRVGGTYAYNVQVGAQMDTFSVIDIGKRRSARDTVVMTMSLHGHKLSASNGVLASGLVHHLINLICCRKRREKNQSYVTSTCATNTNIKKFIEKNCEYVIALIEFINRMCRDVPYFKEFATKGKMKRVITCRIAEMFIEDKSFAEKYINAVFGGVNTGEIAIGEGTTASLVYKTLQELSLKSSKMDVRHLEGEVSSLLMNSHNVIKGAVIKGVTTGMYVKRRGSLIRVDENNVYVVPFAAETPKQR